MNCSKIFPLLFILFLLSIRTGFSQDQTRLYESWTTAGISIPIKPKWRLHTKGTLFGTTDFYKEYKMTFVDVSTTYKPNNKWYFQFLQRTRFIPDRPEQYWLFFDAVYTLKKNRPLFFKNRVRMHYGTDINAPNQDFIRNQIEAHYTINKKVIPFFMVEPFFQFNQLNELHRIRLDVGVNWKIFQTLKCQIGFRHERFYNVETILTSDVILFTLNYTFKK